MVGRATLLKVLDIQLLHQHLREIKETQQKETKLIMNMGCRNYWRNFSKLKGLEGNAKGREFLNASKDAVHDPIVVIGTYLISNLYVNILFDSGADRSYITPEFR